ncbi:energy transducer TonB [Bradyrhizobium sp. 930_D9_N1_4]|uniref:energy transducer TonB n=1 Tax=Bradyrhizobium sp. 930_D9_N1_4 TaxID=3240374 RepID=UPI003F896C22
MKHLVAEDASDLRRWTFSSLAVLTMYSALAASIATWQRPDDLDPAEPAGAVVVELAPLSAAPSTTPTDMPPGPEQVMSEARPEAKPEVAQADDAPELPQAANPEAVVDARTQAQPDAAPQQQAAAATSAPSTLPDRVAPVAVAPTQGLQAQRDSQALATWRSQIAALVERNKRYPDAARSRREQGIAQVRFTLDHGGMVGDARVIQSSGSDTLDGEALALLKRAQPFPAPPDAFGNVVVVRLPIRFTVK